MGFHHQLWGEVTRDGVAYCHWGGQRQSQRLALLAAIERDDWILEICCGEGGALKFLRQAKLAVGIDLSHEALQKAVKIAPAVRADAFVLPFRDGAFSKIISQDADAWIYKEKQKLLGELRRVLAPRGLLVIQTYGRSNQIPQSDLLAGRRCLKRLGYARTALPVIQSMQRIIAARGFVIERVQSLHQLYERDNKRMLRRLACRRERLQARFGIDLVKALAMLLRYERRMFVKKFWSGIIITARKET